MKNITYIFLFSLFPMIINRSIIQAKSLNSFIVTFDPYVSILDKYNRHRYNDMELQQFVTTVATKFTGILVELSDEDLCQEPDTSRISSLKAIANYNAANNRLPKRKLEVWISYKASRRACIEHTLFPERIIEIAQFANKIHNGTVSTLLFAPKIFPFINRTLINPHYHCGLVFKSDICPVNKSINSIPNENVDVVIATLGNSVPSSQQGLTKLYQKITKCLNLPKRTRVGLHFTAPDTDKNLKVSSSKLVDSWNQLMNWTKATGNIAIISKAFDTPYEKRIEQKTCGWWRLIENSSYASAQDYIFEEKALVINNNTNENGINHTFLKFESNFSKNYTGVIFSVSDARRSAISPYSENEVGPILEKISKMFSKLMVLIEDDNIVGIQYLLFELKTIARFIGKIEVIAMLMPDVILHKYFRDPIEFIAEKFGFPGNVITTYILPYTGSKTEAVASFVKTHALRNLSLSSYKFGYSFNVSICSSFEISDKDEQEMVIKTLGDPTAQSVIFYFEEDEETVKLGPKRMFSQRIVVLEKCKNFLSKHNKKYNLNLQIAFVMLHYGSEMSFYRNALAMQNFVLYWEMLSDWAGNSETTIILSNMIDGTRLFKTKGNSPIPEVGWWKYLDLNNRNSSVYCNEQWINIKDEALRLALLQEAEEALRREKVEKGETQSSKSYETVEIVMIVLIPLLVATMMMVLGLYLIRRYYQTTYMTKTELDEFYHGDTLAESKDGTASAYKIPYDKSRFEIDDKSFSINEGETLGSGEFGKVVKGKICKDEQTIDTAIKTVNPYKFRKSTLNGLLSEIKVLAYVGKHENINELLGANTSELKHGKVFIFLEFCELGSLESYLRKIRPPIKDTTDYVRNSKENMYENIFDEKVGGLDPSLRQDLYRWSNEICNGMAYLAMKHVVHADLATRNVLLTAGKTAKICDFGLSRRMYNYCNYVKTQQEPLPWKWMAPESLRLNVFSARSDVWAYGVTLWEIYSLGAVPFPGLSYDPNFVQMLELGFRLSEPEFNDSNMFSLMKKCWHSNPDRRPTFAELQGIFASK